jgi:hypothetical protein
MAYRYLSAECAISKSSLHLQRVMPCEPEICHAWTRVYDSICGDSNLASLTSCSANFVVTTLRRTVNSVTTSCLSTVALRPQKHSSKITSRLYTAQLPPVLRQHAAKEESSSKLVRLSESLRSLEKASGIQRMYEYNPMDGRAILYIVAKRNLTPFSTGNEISVVKSLLHFTELQEL